MSASEEADGRRDEQDARALVTLAGFASGAIVGIGSLITAVVALVVLPRQLVLDGVVDVAAGDDMLPFQVQAQLVGACCTLVASTVVGTIMLWRAKVEAPHLVAFLASLIGTVLCYGALLVASPVMVALAIPTLLLGSALVALGILAATILLMPRLWRRIARVSGGRSTRRPRRDDGPEPSSMPHIHR